MIEKQLLLIDNIYNPSYLTSDYIISESNFHAYNAIINNKWLSYCMILYGESCSGKTHLAHIWKNKINAKFLTSDAGPSELMFGPNIIENFDKKISTLNDELRILHSYNNAIENNNFLLITSSTNPYKLKFTLPDLQSRIHATDSVMLNNPDDELLRVIITKEFYIRALKLDMRIVNFILIHLDRNVNFIIKFIDFLDKESIKNKKSITMNSIGAMKRDFLNLHKQILF